MYGWVCKGGDDEPDPGWKLDVDDKVGQRRPQPAGGWGGGERGEEDAAGFDGQEAEDEGEGREEEGAEVEEAEDTEFDDEEPPWYRMMVFAAAFQH